jgi:hypothetical protein
VIHAGNSEYMGEIKNENEILSLGVHGHTILNLNSYSGIG